MKPKTKLSAVEPTGTRKDDKQKTEPKNSGKLGQNAEVAGVRLTHPDRLLFPELGVTKLDLARYYEAVQDWILPHLINRPLALLRCPQGWQQECFFQKHPGPNFAKGVPRVPIEEKDGSRSDFVYVASVSDLIALVQFNVLELHPWGSQVQTLEAPDTLIFDLDPGPAVDWSRIAGAATGLRDRLHDLGLSAFLQATGGKGLHLVVPIAPTLTWDEAKDFAQGVSKAHAADDPEALTTNMSKRKRQGRIFIDYLRNGRGNTSIARYSVRARENAPIATPLRWDELTPAARSNRYTLDNIRRRLGALQTDPWEGFEEARTAITASMRRELELET